MNKDVALQNFFETFMKSQFPNKRPNGYYFAYPTTNVPKDVPLPYLTYEYVDGDFREYQANSTVNIWFRSESEAIPNKVVREFKKYIEFNDFILCDEGCLWVKAGSPWSQALTDQADDAIKRRYLNVTIEFLTT